MCHPRLFNWSTSDLTQGAHAAHGCSRDTRSCVALWISCHVMYFKQLCVSNKFFHFRQKKTESENGYNAYCILFSPLPSPGNGDRPETPLSRLRPNVEENHPFFLPGTPPQHACATLVGDVQKRPFLKLHRLLPTMPESIVHPDSRVSPCPDRVHDRRER